MNIFESTKFRYYDPLTLGMVAMGVAAGGQIMAGQQQKKAYAQEADLQRQQAELAFEEAKREAQLTANDRRKFLATQKLAFIKNGVSLEGSPLLVLEDTRAQSQEEVNSIIKRGGAQYRLGMTQAAMTQQRGRAALTQGYIGAAGTMASAAFMGSQAGMFDATKGTGYKFNTGGSFSNTAPYRAPRL